MIIDSIIKGYSAFSLLPDEESGHRPLPQSEDDHSDADSDDDLTDDDMPKVNNQDSPVGKIRSKRKPRKDAKTSVDLTKPNVDSVQTSFVDLDQPPVSISRHPSPSTLPRSPSPRVQAIPPPSPVKQFVFPSKTPAAVLASEEVAERAARSSVDVAGSHLARTSDDLR